MCFMGTASFAVATAVTSMTACSRHSYAEILMPNVIYQAEEPLAGD